MLKVNTRDWLSFIEHQFVNGACPPVHPEWKLHSHLDWKLQHVAVEIESQVRGWYNYYNKFGKTEFVKVMNYLNMVLAYWVRRKYKRFHRKPIAKAFSSCNHGCTRQSFQINLNLCSHLHELSFGCKR